MNYPTDDLSFEDLQAIAMFAGPVLGEAKQLEAATSNAPLENGMASSPSRSILEGVQKIEDVVRASARAQHMAAAQAGMYNHPMPVPPPVPQNPYYPNVVNLPYVEPPYQPRPEPSNQMEFDFGENKPILEKVLNVLERIDKNLTTLIKLTRDGQRNDNVPSKETTKITE